jgi:hypothetical protein
MITVHPAERQTQELISANKRPRPNYDSPSRFPGALNDRTDPLISTFQPPPLTSAQKLYASAWNGFTKPFSAASAAPSSSNNRVVAHGPRSIDPMSSSEYTPAVIRRSQSSNPQSSHRPPRRSQTHRTTGPLAGERRYRRSALVLDDVSQNTFWPLGLYALPGWSSTNESSQHVSSSRQEDLPPIVPISERPVNHVPPPSPPANHVSAEEPPTDDMPVEAAPPHDATFARNSLAMERRKRLTTSHNVAQQSLDLIHSIRGGYRILELVTEQGSGGVGKRPSQASLSHLI